MQVPFGDCLEVLLLCLGQPSLFPSAGCTNTLRCKPQTASEVLKKEKTEPNLVPLSLGCSGKGTRMKQGGQWKCYSSVTAQGTS